MNPDVVLPLAQAVSQMVLGVISADGTGPVSGGRESKAAQAFIQQTPAEGNPLLQALLGILADPHAEISEVDLKQLDLAALLAQIGSRVQALEGAPEHILPVKQFIFDLAQHVAQTAGAGFMGSGTKVTMPEQEFLAQLKQALGL